MNIELEEEKTFRTKTGFCHILPDKIVLTRDGIIGNVASVAVGDNITRILVINGFIALILFYSASNSFYRGERLTSVLYGMISLFFIYGLLTSLNNSATPVIHRHKIKEIKLIKAIFGLTRSRFEVLFEDDNGSIKKRLIMLPGSMSGGQKATEKAVKIMTEEKLLNEYE